MDERVKFKVRRETHHIFVDLWFDDCFLGSRIVVGGDEGIANLVQSGDLKLTQDYKLVWSDDGAPFGNYITNRAVNPKEIQRTPHTTSSGYQKV